ncbi:MAG: hypothetical protein ACI9CF_001886 [Candidatus Omnitrophota bacterium]|jgi:hypothetical protein
MDTVIDGVDYGPLACLIGMWRGDKGLDIAPEPDGQEVNPYHETILFEAIGDVTNAEKQVLTGLRYHQVVTRQSTGLVFHNETGYWMWDAKTGIVFQTLTIPRGVSLVAGGPYQPNEAGDTTILEVKAASGDSDWGIVEAPFMRSKATTKSFEHRIEVDGNTMAYTESTVVDIYGKTFNHTDENSLKRD